MKDNIKAECSLEVKNALQGNIRALQTNIDGYEKRIDELISKIDEQMKEVNDKMQKHLWEFEEKKRKFFNFDGVRNVFFWASQVVSFGTLGLLVYFLFFRG